MPDLTLSCVDCQGIFIFTEGEQAFFAARSFSPPRRCKLCRDLRKNKKELASTSPPNNTPYPTYSTDRGFDDRNYQWNDREDGAPRKRRRN